ncbi:unnamed protein product [Strongylus vulgaris]|uniref:Uncharacterized protein n=1 Tax=Strongylus vulgaris TaxID=40348 RepID=A0A3P7JHQ2_STRVU|nr:unnamed protein product [Strongylus vulgaris]
MPTIADTEVVPSTKGIGDVMETSNPYVSSLAYPKRSKVPLKVLLWGLPYVESETRLKQAPLTMTRDNKVHTLPVLQDPCKLTWMKHTHNSVLDRLNQKL